MYPRLILPADGQQELAKLDRQLDSPCFLTVGELARSPMNLSDG
jgi:hypothetical protein